MTAMKATSKAGKGRVQATMNGHRALVSVRIKPEMMAEDNLDELQLLVVKAVNGALKQIDEKLGSPYGTLASLPSLFSDYFES